MKLLQFSRLSVHLIDDNCFIEDLGQMLKGLGYYFIFFLNLHFDLLDQNAIALF